MLPQVHNAHPPLYTSLARTSSRPYPPVFHYMARPKKTRPSVTALCHGPYGLWSMVVPGAVLHIVQITLALIA